MAYDVFERRHEVVVAGGGLCGWAAAMAARRAGRQVLLVDRRATIGWEVSWAFQAQLGQGPLAEELYGRLEAKGAARNGFVSPAAAELEIFQMAEEAGVELLLGAVPLAPVAEDGRLCGLLVGGKSGQHLLTCDLLVDATDNMLLARELGASVQQAASTGGEMSIMLNCLPQSPDGPLELGNVGRASGVTVWPAVFGGEARISFRVDSLNITEAYLAVPEVLEVLRRHESLRLALVSAISPQIMPTAPTHQLAAPPQDMGGRFMVAHPGAGAADGQGAANSIPGRLALGEAAGRRAAEAWAPSTVCTRASVGSLLPKPPHREADVVVVGGGTAGPLAAIAAGRQGASVVLLETMTYLGGMGTGGGIHHYYHGISGGMQDEVDRRTEEMASLFVGHADIVGRSSEGLLAGWHPDAKKIVLLQMALEAGVHLVFDAIMTGAISEKVEDEALNHGTVARRHPARPASAGQRLSAVLAADPAGMQVFHGKVFIDATGDGDLAAMAGAQFNMGRDGDGLMHAFSQSCGRLAAVTEDYLINRDAPGAGIDRPKMVIVNFDAGFCDPDDITDLTRARQLGLKHLRKDRWSDDNRWTYIAPHLGLRQGRQIIGDYQITLLDQIRGQTFPDVVAYAASNFDNHARDYENESDLGALWVWMLGQWHTKYGCEIPYRALLPKGIEGLLVPCRALAVTQDASYQLRMQRDLQRTGEAAGIAAAMAARQGLGLREIDIAAVQDELRKTGSLEVSQRPKPALLSRPSQELTEAGPAGDGQALWQLVFDHGEALPAVRQKLGSNLPAERYWSAVALAMTGDASGAAELRAAVIERRDNKSEARAAAPQWHGAITMLGRIGDKEAVPVLSKVLVDKDAPPAALVASARALGRIGEAAAADALRALLERDDIDLERPIASHPALGKKFVTDDSRWQLDLAAAEALARIGQPAPEVAEKYLTDERAYVRRYARRVLETRPATE